MPKMRIEESAARRQAKLDSGAEVQVGVNKYRLEKEDTNFEVRKLDNVKTREGQIKRINKAKSTRDPAAAEKALNALRESAKTGQGNLLELSVSAAQANCTLGEISSALEEHFGRYVPHSSIVRGAYG